MSQNHEETPDAVRGLNAESDVVAQRSGAETSTSGRPVPADPPEAQAAEQSSAPEQPAESPKESEVSEESERQEGREETEAAVTEKEVRPDVGPTG